MTDAVFRADSFAALDPLVVDKTVLMVLNGFFSAEWSPLQRIVNGSPFASDEHLCVFSVRVSGLTEQELSVRVPQASCEDIVALLGLPGQATCQDVVAELANTLAGRLKIALADGLSTGIPLQVSADDPRSASSPVLPSTEEESRAPLGAFAYRGAFSCGSLVIEVLAGG